MSIFYIICSFAGEMVQMLMRGFHDCSSVMKPLSSKFSAVLISLRFVHCSGFIAQRNKCDLDCGW